MPRDFAFRKPAYHGRFPDFDVFHSPAHGTKEKPYPRGWYWKSPLSEHRHVGPFDSSKEAYDEAKSIHDDANAEYKKRTGKTFNPGSKN